MAQRQIKLGKVQVTLSKSSLLLKVLLMVLIVLSITALVALSWVRSTIHTRTENMRDEAAALEYENEQLKDKIGDLGSVQSIRDIAQEELGMVPPDAILIKPE